MEFETIKITCANCFIFFWITKEHYDRLNKSKEIFYCPSGHTQSYQGKSDKQLLQEEQERVKEYCSLYEEELENNNKLNNTIRTYKGHMNRKRKLRDGEEK